MTVCDNIDVQVRKKNKKNAAYDQQSALLYVYDNKTVKNRQKWSNIVKNSPPFPNPPIPQSPNNGVL